MLESQFIWRKKNLIITFIDIFAAFHASMEFGDMLSCPRIYKRLFQNLSRRPFIFHYETEYFEDVSGYA